MEGRGVNTNYSSVDLFLQDLLSRYRRYPKGYAVACCPFHDDTHPSLFVDPTTGRFSCKACGETGGLVKLTAKAKGLTLDEARTLLQRLGLIQKPEKEREVAYYYTDEAGFIQYRIVRYRLPDGGKTFVVERYDFEKESWVPGKGDAPDLLYNLPDVLEADTVLVVEGEKCVEALKKYGYVATTNPHGAGSWKPEYACWLEGKTVYLLPDNDPPGISHMRDVAGSLEGKATVLWVDPSLYAEEEGDDIADFIERLETQKLSEEEIKKQIQNLLERAEPYDPDRFSLLGELSLKPEDLEESKGVEWLIDGFLPQRTLTLITARFGSGKSLFALALTKHFIEQERKALYLDLDNPMGVIKKRIEKAGLRDALGRSLFYLTSTKQPLDHRSGTWKGLKKELQNREHLVVVIDTLKNFAQGVDLNSDKETILLMRELMNIRDLGHTVVVLHHVPKKLEEEHPFKNSTSVVDCADLAFHLFKKESKVVLENFKDRVGGVQKKLCFELSEDLTLKPAIPPEKEIEFTIAWVILKLLPPEGYRQGHLVQIVSDYLKTHHDDVPHYKAKILEILDKYEGKLWSVVRARGNTKIYRRLVDPSQFSENPTYIYIGSENRKTLEPQGFEASPPEGTIGKLNGDKGSSDSGGSEGEDDLSWLSF